MKKKLFGSNALHRRLANLLRIDKKARKSRRGLIVRQVLFGFILLLSLALQMWFAPSAHATPKQSQSHANPAGATRGKAQRDTRRVVPPSQDGISVCERSTSLNNIQDCIMVDAPYDGGTYQPADQKVYNPLAPNSILYFITPLEATANNPLVQNAWSKSLMVVDILSVIALMLNGLKIMIAGSVFRYSDAIEGLPGVLTALIAAHVSFIFIGFFLGLNNTLSGDLYTWVNNSSAIPVLAQKEGTHTDSFNEVVHLARDPNGVNDSELPKKPLDPAKSQGATCSIESVIPDSVINAKGSPSRVPGAYAVYWNCNSAVVLSDDKTTEFSQEVLLTPPPSGIYDPRLPQNAPANSDSQGRMCVRSSVNLETAGRVALTGHYALHWRCVLLVLTPTDLNFTNIDIGSIMTSMGNIFPIMVQVMGVMVIGQVIIRLFFLNLYIALAPIGLACWGLPGKAGQPITRLWLSGFLSTVLVQFLQAIALIVISILGRIFLTVYSQPLQSVIDVDLFRSIIQLSMLWLILQIPGLLNTAPMRTLVEAGQAATQVVSASVGAQIAIVQAGAQVGSSMVQNTVGAAGFLGGMF